MQYLHTQLSSLSAPCHLVGDSCCLQTAAAVPAGCFVEARSLLCLQPVMVGLWVCLAGAAGTLCICIVFLPLYLQDACPDDLLSEN